MPRVWKIGGVGLVAALIHAGDTVVPAQAIVIQAGPEKADAERARADARRARADDKKIEAETIGQELENEIKRIRLGTSPGQTEAHKAEKHVTLPASFFVPFALIERSSQENGLSPAHGVHLINRGLPDLFGILRAMPGLQITVERRNS